MSHRCIPYAPFDPSMYALARVNALRGRLARGEPVRSVVVGVGRSGMSAVKLLKHLKADLKVADDRPFEALSPELQTMLDGVPFGPITEEGMNEAELVVLSPGVPRHRPEFEKAVEDGRLVGEIELASWFVKIPLIGITGTNGKSTTTALVAHLLNCSGIKAFAGGNLGIPLSELAVEPGDYEVAVVELSSYQLESVVDINFRVACWLNLSPDHLDRYRDVDTYAAAKRRLLERRSVQGLGVLNADDEWCTRVGIRRSGAQRWFTTHAQGRLTSVNGIARIKPDLLQRNGENQPELYQIRNSALRGNHNVANAAAAIECARALKARPEAIQEGLDSFKGLPHRIEFSGEVNGVSYFNDSKATNIDSAITGVRAFKQPIWLIVGGTDKGAPWSPLVEAALPWVREVLTIGAAAPLAKAAFEAGSAIPVVKAKTLKKAVRLAHEHAVRGGVVLLSPACSSFDQFSDYCARGDAFKAAVAKLSGRAEGDEAC